MIHFIRPLYLLGYIPALIYLCWIMSSYQQKNPWQKICDSHLLVRLLQNSHSSTHKAFNFILVMIYSLSIFALAGPSWDKITVPSYKELRSVMVVLDLSTAMQSTDIKPDRLTRAKYKIRDLINAMSNAQMGLVVFTQEAFDVSPLSQDATTLNALLDELKPSIMPIAGSDLGQGLKNGLALLQQAGSEHGTILLLTSSTPTANAWAIAKQIADQGYRLTILAMLANNADNQNTLTQLTQLAAMGNGNAYPFSSDSTDIRNIVQGIEVQHTTNNTNDDTTTIWHDVGPWFCLFLIPCLLLIFRERIWNETH